jgi:RNA polymerase-associated protein
VDHDWYRLMDKIMAGGKPATKARKELRESLTVTAPVFASKPFFMSSEFSLVDCSIGPLLWRLPALGVELPAQAKALEEYAARLFERPSFLDSLTETEKEMRE